MKRLKHLFLILMFICLTAAAGVSAQTTERIELDGSALAAGQSFRFTVTVDSDENLSFLGSEAQVTALLCPVILGDLDCQLMTMEPQQMEGTSIKLSFTVEELPVPGDYTLDIQFDDDSGMFARASAYYIIRGVRETVEAETRKITLRPELLDESGKSLIYGNTVYVNELYTFRITADGSLNDSVNVHVAIPASLSAVPMDPYSECLSYLNEDGTAMDIPGSEWNAANGNVFSCRLRITDAAWVTANPIEFTLVKPETSTYKSNVEFVMDKLAWNYYPVSCAKMPASHQFLITDSSGTLVCSDNVPCGMFKADEVYTMTYKFPADWGAAMPAGRFLTAEAKWPESWVQGIQNSADADLAAEYGDPCAVDSEGKTDLALKDNDDGRYSASCTFVPSSVVDPVQSAMKIHLNDTSYQVSDLNVWLPGTISKTQTEMKASLTLQTTAGSEPQEQIQNNALGTLYRTAGEFPNTGGTGSEPALYTLKAEISGIPATRKPQAFDSVLVNWSLLDRLAEAGDLPACLVPADSGYVLGSLEQTEEGTWLAACAFRFPETIAANTQAGPLSMQLVSGAYKTSANVYMSGNAFRRDTLYVDLSVPDHMLLMQPTGMSVRLNDSDAGMSDYLQSVLAASDYSLNGTWDYNYLTDCLGIYEFDENGAAMCSANFTETTDTASTMHFELVSTTLERLFNIQYRPSQDIQVPAVSRIGTELTPSLSVRMTADSEEIDVLSGGSIGTLYRTAGEFPNALGNDSAPARYSLRAEISGILPGSEPQPGDQVLVNWTVLDSLAAAGDLPSCLVPSADGYSLGVLTAVEEGKWQASCDFRFPQTLNTAAAGGPLTMHLNAAAYTSDSRTEMSGNPFRAEKLYVDLDVPSSIPLMQQTAFSVRLSDSSGSLSDYMRALLASDSVSLFSDWIYNYATDCQGLYQLTPDGTASCSAYFDLPTEDDSVMHFELNSSLAGNLFETEFRPSADISIAGISKTQAVMTPSLKLQMTSASEETDVISGGFIGTLYRTAGEFPNASAGSSLPARYSLKAEISGVYAGSEPQPGDHVVVNWPVLDSLAAAGDLPSCLTPAADGYSLGVLTADGEGKWLASCDFFFPQTIDENTAGGPLTMHLDAAAYTSEAKAEMSGAPFRTETLYADLDVPTVIPLMKETTLSVRLSDSSGGLSDYIRALLAYDNVSLYSDWAFNYATDCQGLYDLSQDGTAVCNAYFNLPTEDDSVMHFELNSSMEGNLFRTEFRPSADITITGIAKTQAELSPSLKLYMTGFSEETDVISGGSIGTLYRTTSEFPNAFADETLPARYSLRAEVSGLIDGAAPEIGDYVEVSWPILDGLAATGDLPSCLTPAAEGYMLGSLMQAENGNWVASCDFRFPETMDENTASGPLEMRLESAGYDASASVAMNSAPFKRETLYIDLDIPQQFMVRETANMHTKLSDPYGGISDYLWALLIADKAMLYSDWDYNYASSCQGLYEFNENWESDCSVTFDIPTMGSSMMHFMLDAPSAGTLYDVVFRPGADIFIPEVRNVQASLTVKLLHAGTEIPLPAADTEAFEVGEDYQLQFILTPAPEYSKVLSTVNVDNEGVVQDWWIPLVIHWSALPDGQAYLNFTRDGDHFIARYDFNFANGDILLDGYFSILTVDIWIDGWDIEVQNGISEIRLPGKIVKKPLTLSFSDFTVDNGLTRVSDLYASQEASFDLYFSGSMDTLDISQLMVGYDDHGISNALSCMPDYANGLFRCSIRALCSDTVLSETSAVCASDLSLYAVYNGDSWNSAAEAEPKTFSVRRSELQLTPVPEGSLNDSDLVHIQAASDDLQYMGYGSLNISGWRVDSFLPRQKWTQYGDEFMSYPVIFRYSTSAPGGLDQSLLHLDVAIQSGSAAAPVDEVISLPAFMVTNDTITFLLDFGSFDILDDGRSAAEALERAVTIKSLTARYSGSELVAPASAKFESEGLTFALKVATAYDLEIDQSMPYTLMFGGVFANEGMAQYYTVYCSQLFEALECSSEMPEEEPVFADEPDPNDADPFAAAVSSAIISYELAFEDQGCWGGLRIHQAFPQIYINNGFNPQCYIAAQGDRGQLLIATNVR